jgi:hypothetical protein
MSLENNEKSVLAGCRPERLVGMTTAAVAAAAGVGVVGTAPEAHAEIIVHEINQAVPANIDGLYVNILTGGTGSSGAVGLPYLNPYGDPTNVMGWWGGGSFRGVNIGLYADEVSALPVGFVVEADIPDAPGDGAGTPRFNTTAATSTSWADGLLGDFSLNALNYFGFKFQVGADTHYGWGSIEIGANLAERTLRQVAFEDVAGQSILVGDLGVSAPSSIDAAYVVHNGFTGAGSPIDSGKFLHKETATPTALTYDNLINSSRGINGIGFDISGTGNAAAITAADFVFEVSQIPFTSGNPTWIPAPAPASVVVTPGTPDQIVVSWSNNAIANRWLKVTVLGNANTGLAANEVYYIGHLLGESGPAVPTYTVAFVDINPIRAGIGSTVGSESPLDIDKNGTVAFADISAMRANVGAQLGNLTVPPPVQ